MNNAQLATRQNNPVSAIKAMTRDPKMVGRFREVMGEKAPQFMASVVSAVSANKALQQVDPNGVMGAAMIAATLNLDINPSLGFSAIVPYNEQAQFQIMTKGFVQLALRSGQYANVNAGWVYEDEYHGQDLITGELHISDVADGMRSRDVYGDTYEDMKKAGIIGFFAYIRLVNGFERTEFWTLDKVYNHGRRYSKSFNYKGAPWQTNFRAMARKTVLKNTLSSWGILSTQMQAAILKDQVVADLNGNEEYIDNPDDITTPAQSVEEATESTQPPIDDKSLDQQDDGLADEENEYDLDAAWGER